ARECRLLHGSFVWCPAPLPCETRIMGASGMRSALETAASTGSGATARTAVEGGPTVLRMVLGGRLRRLREASGLSREQAGDHIRGSDSKISRLELGRTSIRERDLVDLLQLYGITDSEELAAFQ